MLRSRIALLTCHRPWWWSSWARPALARPHSSRCAPRVLCDLCVRTRRSHCATHPPTSRACSLLTRARTPLQSLVKRYTRHNLNDVKGPITVVTNKNRRVTFFECPNDLNAMIDLAKIADLALLTIDGSFGFEMETFEFLNIMQTHGFPKVMGVLTHLDHFRDNKRLRRTKKVRCRVAALPRGMLALRHSCTHSTWPRRLPRMLQDLKARFWAELYDGAKLFYLSGVSNGSYNKTEIHNLSLYISRIKFRPLVWRNTHSYVLADRMEDITDPATLASNPAADRRMALFGFVRGTSTHTAHTMEGRVKCTCGRLMYTASRSYRMLPTLLMG
ncbi:hypothetical protein EON62_06485, partial [archaeon]